MSFSSLQKSDDHGAKPGSARADRRLSVLELCVLAIGLVCFCLVVVNTVQDQRNQTQAGRLASAAEAVSVWVAKAHLARKDGSGLQPVRCNTDQYQPLLSCFSDMVSPGQPFAGLKNPINSAPDAPAFAFIAAPDSGAGGQPCADLPGPVSVSAPSGGYRERPQNWAGIIVVKTDTVANDLSLTVNRLNIGFCDTKARLVWTSRSVRF